MHPRQSPVQQGVTDPGRTTGAAAANGRRDGSAPLYFRADNLFLGCPPHQMPWGGTSNLVLHRILLASVGGQPNHRPKAHSARRHAIGGLVRTTELQRPQSPNMLNPIKSNPFETIKTRAESSWFLDDSFWTRSAQGVRSIRRKLISTAVSTTTVVEELSPIHSCHCKRSVSPSSSNSRPSAPKTPRNSRSHPREICSRR